MTLNRKKTHTKAVFDFPSAQILSKSFLIRRPLSLAGKSLLSAKNEPINPSRNELSLKCYTNSPLFFLSPPVGRCKKFKPKVEPTNLEVEKDFQIFPGNILRTPQIVYQPGELKLHEVHELQGDFAEAFSFKIISEERPPSIINFKNEKIAYFIPSLPLVISGLDFLCSLQPGKDLESIDKPDERVYLANTSSSKQIGFSFTEKALTEIQTFLDAQTVQASIPFSFQQLPVVYEPLKSFFSEAYQTSLSAAPTRSNFSPFPKGFNSCRFDFRPEIGKNLILETKTTLFPKIGESSPRNWQPKEKSAFPIIVKDQNFKSEILADKSSGKFTESSHIKASQRTIRAKDFFRDFGILSNFNLEKSLGAFTGVTAQQQNICRNPLRLKLKLLRPGFKFSAFQMKPLTNYQPQPWDSILSKLPAIDFILNPGSVAERVLLNYRAKLLNTIFSKERFCRKFLNLRFLTRSQARYTAAKSKKIALPNLPAKAMLTPLKSDALRGKISNSGPENKDSFSHIPGLFNDFVGILGRPTAFIMSLTQMSFTDIFLPASRRRLKSPLGTYGSLYCLPKITKRAVPLKNYRFLAVKNEKFSYQAKLEKRRHVEIARNSLNCVSKLFKLKEPPASFFSQIENFKDPKFMESIGKSSPVGLIDGIPGAICSYLNLTMNILQPSATGAICQKEIVAPPQWQKTTRGFVCRMRLAPYPFGFPEFTFKKTTMKVVQRNRVESIFVGNSAKIEIPWFFFSPSKRVFRSKYNLKSPEKWIFPDKLTKGTSHPKLDYKTPWSNVENSFYIPEKLANYEFSWMSNGEQKPFHCSYEENFFLDDSKAKAILSPFKILPGPDSTSMLPRTLSKPEISKRTVSRLLLGKIALICKNRIDTSSFVAWHKKPLNENLIISELSLRKLFPNFIEKFIHNKPSYREILAFYHDFGEISNGQKINIGSWKARFREFFFPFSPTPQDWSVSREKYFELDDTTQVQSFDPEGELRTTQILYLPHSQASVNEVYKNDLNRSCLEACKQEAFHIVEETAARETFKIRKLSNYKSKPNRERFKFIIRFRIVTQQLFKRFQSCEKWMLSQKRPPTFACSSPSIKCLEQTNLLRHPTDSGNFTMGNFHWVILLKNFQNISLKSLGHKIEANISDSIFTPDTAKSMVNCYQLSEHENAGNWTVFYPTKPIFHAEKSSRFVLEALPIKVPNPALTKSELVLTPHEKPPQQIFAKLIAFTEKTFEISSKTQKAVLKSDLVLQESNKIFLEEYRMHGNSAPAKKKNRLRSRILRQKKSEFHHPSFPEWLDMEMDNKPNSADVKRRNL